MPTSRASSTCDAERIRIRQGDTDTIPAGGGTGGARSLYSEGQAILVTTRPRPGAGRVAQGFGQAVLERAAYDPDSGQLLSGTFMDYALPRADDLPDIEVELLEIPCETNPLV